VVGRDLFDAEAEVMGFDDDLGKDEKRARREVDPIEDFAAPSLRPVVIVDPDLEEPVQEEDIDHGQEEPEKLVGVPLPADPQDNVRLISPEDLHEIGDFGRIELFIGADVHQVLAFGGGDPVLERARVSLVLFVDQERRVRVFFDFRPENLEGLVFRPVLDQDDLPMPFRMGLQDGEEIREHPRDVLLLIINRRDEADKWV